MPHFYFDATVNGDALPDPEGVELDTYAAARQEALRAVAEMVKDQHLDGDTRDFTIAIREGAEPVATIRLSLKIEDAS
ncbi:MAG: DUF6894 family protein [Microvirga sp.]